MQTNVSIRYSQYPAGTEIWSFNEAEQARTYPCQEVCSQGYRQRHRIGLSEKKCLKSDVWTLLWYLSAVSLVITGNPSHIHGAIQCTFMVETSCASQIAQGLHTSRQARLRLVQAVPTRQLVLRHLQVLILISWPLRRGCGTSSTRS